MIFSGTKISGGGGLPPLALLVTPVMGSVYNLPRHRSTLKLYSFRSVPSTVLRQYHTRQERVEPSDGQPPHAKQTHNSPNSYATKNMSGVWGLQKKDAGRAGQGRRERRGGSIGKERGERVWEASCDNSQIRPWGGCFWLGQECSLRTRENGKTNGLKSGEAVVERGVGESGRGG